jgi:mannan endo-1,4-beta-mannosidase
MNQKFQKNIFQQNTISFLILISFWLGGCMTEINEFNSKELQKELNLKLADSNATKETVLLYHNLKKLSETKVIFGHHDATAYGIGWRDEPNRSDVKEVVGSYPGLYGWDFGMLQWSKNEKHVLESTTLRIKEAFQRGGVNTFCWHYNNPVTEKSFYDTTIVVNKILPGGGFYLKYLEALDEIADYSSTLVDSAGKPIPIIFRPFHEFDGNWFWWGKPYCTAEEFKYLWQTTVSYLRDKRGVKNFIYAFSPDCRFKTPEEFLERYPGDEFVDLLGMDNYWDFTPDGAGLDAVTKKLQIITGLALEKNKIAALTETGSESILNDRWWTDRLLKSFDYDSVKIAFAMVWRNNDKKHHYAPYPGHPSVPNFTEFSYNPKILFEKHLPNLYSKIISDDDIKKIDEMKKIELLLSIYPTPIKL